MSSRPRPDPHQDSVLSTFSCDGVFASSAGGIHRYPGLIALKPPLFTFLSPSGLRPIPLDSELLPSELEVGFRVILNHHHLRSPCRERVGPFSTFVKTRPRKPRGPNHLVAHLGSRRKTLLGRYHRSVTFAATRTLRALVAWTLESTQMQYLRREGMGRRRPFREPTL